MNHKILIFIILSSICPASYAKLGEKREAVEASYGKPVETYTDIKGRVNQVYSSGGFMILVNYINGTSESELYYKKDDGSLSNKELQDILARNAIGGSWQELPADFVEKAQGKGYRVWAIVSSGAISAYGPADVDDKRFSHVMSVSTKTYNQQNQSLDRAQGRK